MMIKEPKISFARWEPWYMRGTTTSYDPFDPPPDFDVSGIYLLAHFKNKKQKEANKDGQLYLNPYIIYIGQSKKITRRLEGSRHEKVRNEYKKLFKDNDLKYLYFSLCYTDWTSWDFRNKELSSARYACLLYLERKLIWEFAKIYSKVPILNKK
jgi:hypothetical protein